MLTVEQLAILKADILADPVLSALPMNSDGAWEIAAAYNQPAAVAHYVWATNTPVTDIMANGFDWTLIDNLSVGKARIWEWMANLGYVNPSHANVRSGILAVFTGNSAATVAMRLGIFGHCQRLATRLEKLFATGTGTTVTDTGTGPATMAVEGQISYNEIEQARNS
jgi:hypothetical protein